LTSKKGVKMKIDFTATIKEVKSRTGVDLEKTGRLVIEFTPLDETLDLLNRLHRPDKTVLITIDDNDYA
jgi:hypothetical protein